uniref:BSD domain-containing protein n=1 Tax=Romanomermis culicivorax TaxID=13658 RepID=A0A915JYX8_ROMCU
MFEFVDSNNLLLLLLSIHEILLDVGTFKRNLTEKERIQNEFFVLWKLRNKFQKISPEGKPKIQLQLCLNDGQNFTFHFCNDKGSTSQLDDREKVKNLVQQKLSTTKVKLNTELEMKEKILRENKHLFLMYKELVTTNIIAAEEFWKTYAKEEFKGAAEESETTAKSQKVGVSSGFLSNVVQTDGCNGVKFTLTTDVIQSIFRTYPSVKKKHDELVPATMTETEFWTNFFQSQYFHRDRNAGRHGISSAGNNIHDYFVDCLKLDNEDLQNQTNILRSSKRSIEEVEDDRGLATAIDNDDDTRGKVRNPANAELIRKFNYRSGRVLQACLGDDDKASTSDAPRTMASLGALLPSTSTQVNDRLILKKQKVSGIDEILNNDLESQTANDPSYALNLRKTEKYQMSGIRSPEMTNSVGVISNKRKSEALKWKNKMLSLSKTTWSVEDKEEVISTDAAYDVLLDMSSHLSRNDTISEEVTQNLSEEIQAVYVALGELLRHFWSCFPVTTPEQEQK